MLRRLAAALDVARPFAEENVSRIADDVAAAIFHAEQSSKGGPSVVVLLGGTGTGKSTLSNRLLGVPDRGDQAVTATSFRRTHTAGCVAITKAAEQIPDGWLGVPVREVPPEERPARGVPDRLSVVELDGTDLPLVLVDTPDLDGDKPEHHRQAERAFRWAQVVILVATPEKYQLPEVPRYAKLADRYRLPRRFVMNKADDLDAPDDWQQQLSAGGKDAHVYVVPRDDAALTVADDRQLAALRRSLVEHQAPPASEVQAGVRARAGDVAGRSADGVLAPLDARLQTANEAAERLRQLVKPETGVDVHPMTRHLQRRLRQQSVLYLMGPGRIIDRAKQVPGFLARLPRTSWDLVTRGKLPPQEERDEQTPDGAPDFNREVVDGFRLLQSRCADVLRDLDLPADEADAAWKIEPQAAREVVTKEIEELQRWLESRWDSKPRDTRALEWLAKHIPGSKKIAKLSEAAPYLLASVSFATSTFSMGADQVIIGGYLAGTWLTERMSNEVAAKTRETNQNIGKGFAALCDLQVKRAGEWAKSLAPTRQQLDELEAAIEAAAEVSQS